MKSLSNFPMVDLCNLPATSESVTYVPKSAAHCCTGDVLISLVHSSFERYVRYQSPWHYTIFDQLRKVYLTSTNIYLHLQLTRIKKNHSWRVLETMHYIWGYRVSGPCALSNILQEHGVSEIGSPSILGSHDAEAPTQVKLESINPS
jgi:hypothetical protein